MTRVQIPPYHPRSMAGDCVGTITRRYARKGDRYRDANNFIRADMVEMVVVKLDSGKSVRVPFSDCKEIAP